MPLRAIDFHVHRPTPDWLDGSMSGYVEAAEAYFRSVVQRQSLDELADRYRELEVQAVLLAWDADTATGRPRDTKRTGGGRLPRASGRLRRSRLGRSAQGPGGRGRGGEHRDAGPAGSEVS